MKNRDTIFILSLLSSAALCMADDEGFKRYQLILDKPPFGQAPPEAEVVQVAASQSFARNLRLSMLFEGPDGTTRAGIVDNTTKKSYILRVGEPQDGLEVVEADVKTSEAMLRKGNEVALFKLEAGAGEPISKSEQSSRQSSSAERRRALLQKVEERRTQAEPPPEPKLSGEALKKHLENVQMDAIRNGLPPLPLPLTPEMDAQLVKEGVLPPQ
ncbi:MAG TPA: hypothetical protein PLD51_07420 [Pontiellaceae bacterium]|nr:hypothetical protein [Pontiellaceae bacterium]HPR83672.1 hypothetical protein [Pontiellaceae bacterium]